MRVYQPTTLTALAAAYASGPVQPDVDAVHADPLDDADADDDLAWYASQELDSLLTGIV
jgi:hypothetical protein